MEGLSLSWGGASPKEAPSRRHGMNIPGKDIWLTVRNGTVQNVEAALVHLKKSNGNIDARNPFGSSALHIAVWRNHLPIVRRLLAAGADPNARDGESGWSSLHRALHFGHIAVAGVLIEAGGSLVLEDNKGRTPIDLSSGPVKQCLASSSKSGGKEVFSWGNGSNYQLGIGSTGILRVPGRIDALEGFDVIAVAAAKFHSVALTASGEVFSWGFGRGGRLGHPDFDIHSGQVAVITPRQIIHGFGYRGVSVIAVAKHHTVVATNGGEVYTWGSNREGRLGYPSVDTQPTPRRVSTLKARVVAVAAANKHSAVLTEAGEVYTWGCNTEGQLGYGTSNSISNYIPRVVECLKGKKLVAISTAKYHTIVLGAEGEVLTWGYKMVNPRRVSVIRYAKKAGGQPVKFHISERLHVVAISAGMTHSLALSEDGLVFYWFSADPALKCRQLLSLAGQQAVSVSSSKFQTAVATAAGDVYSWDGKNCKADTIPVPVRVHGIKHATQLSVGENHTVAVAALFIPEYPQRAGPEPLSSNQSLSKTDEEVELSPETEDEDISADVLSPRKWQPGLDGVSGPVPSLKDLCQRVAAQSVVEPKNALQVLEFADALGADILKGHCKEFISRNLDYILTMAPVLFGHIRPSLLAEVEKALDACSTQPWSHRRLPTPSATLPAVIDSEEEENGLGVNAYARGSARDLSVFNTAADKKSEGFLQQTTENGEAILKQMRAVRKKLQQIEALELKQAKGHILDDQQLLKVQTKRELERELASLELGLLPEPSMNGLKQDVKHYRETVDKSQSVGENYSRGSGSKQRRRLEKTKSKGRGSYESLQIGRTDADAPGRPATQTQDSSDSFTPDTKSLDEGINPASLPTSTSSFVTISGFDSHTSKRSEPELLEPSPSSSGSKTPNRVSAPAAEISPLPRKLTTSSVASPGQSPVPRKMTTLGKKVVKGGLSVFLSGALDDVHKPEAPLPPPLIPKVEGPAWGGAHLPKESASLRAIQTQQKTELKLAFSHAVKIGSGSQPTEEKIVPSSKQVVSTKQVTVLKSAGKSHVVAAEDTESPNKRIPLSHFVRTPPIAVTHNRSPSNVNLETSPPPWAASTSSVAAQSLRDIQLEQVQSKFQRTPLSRGSPHQAISPVGALTSSGNASTSDHNLNSTETPNRWYKPELGSPSNLRCIQIEEKAMKELRQLYKNVKLVRNDGS
ncbi:unnamed protein product [Calypogeia fissa]